MQNNRPYWRYTNNPNFFEQCGGARIDWENREVDIVAKNNEEKFIFICRKMNFWEIIIYSPVLETVKKYQNYLAEFLKRLYYFGKVKTFQIEGIDYAK